MTDRFEAILDEGISALQAGVPIKEILAEAPDYATELRPLLYAATILTDPKPELIPAQRKAALRAEYMAQVAELPPMAPTFSEKIAAVLNIVGRRLTPKAVLNDLLTIGLTIVLTLTMSFLLLNYAAKDSLPGDLLYSIKRISENGRLLVTFDEEDQAALAEQFNQKRLVEIKILTEQNRAAVVQFRGILDTQGENLWVIEEQPVFLPEDITIEGNPQENDLVEVIGLLRTTGVLVADTIRQIK